MSEPAYVFLSTTEFPSTPREWHRKVLSLSVPIVLANLAQPVLSAVDTAIAGHMADVAMLGGVALGGLFFSFVFWGFGFLRMGTTGLVAQAFGAGNDESLRAIVLRAFALALTIGLVLLAFRVPLIEWAIALLCARRLCKRGRGAGRCGARRAQSRSAAAVDSRDARLDRRRGGPVQSLLFAIGPWIIDQLTDQPAVRTTARVFLAWAAASPLLSAWSFALDGVFIGATRTRDMMVSMASAMAVFIVLALFLEPLYGNHGLWAALMMFMVIRAVTLGIRLPGLIASAA